ncbi:hypothetical protein [Pedococcus sp. 5OH_020]|uniref:hypothetical protein n=1 Tax=Pedococcus sp. 5OH_020 TaxID=2989814 RepID=UPI0022E9ABA7|nr:hypothetical protein [Pedococcus sp. 5OH_020]
MATIKVPRHVPAGQPPATQTAFRCLVCDTQWVDRDAWLAEHAGDKDSGDKDSGDTDGGDKDGVDQAGPTTLTGTSGDA